MNTLDNQASTTETVAQTTVAPVIDAGNPQPASTPGPADTAASGQPTEGEGQQPDKPTRDRRAEKRISTLLRKNDEAQREIGYWRGIAEAQRGQAQPASAEADAKPRPDQFKSYDEYVEALTDWKTDQKLKAHKGSEPSKPQPEVSPTQDANARAMERLMEDAEDIEDFEDVMETITDPRFPVSAAMRDYLLETERPAHLAQWLADNRKEARRIYGLTTAAAVRELDKVTATIAKPAQPKTSTAPPPVPTVGGRSVTSKDLSKVSIDEYAVGWRDRMAKARSR